MAIRFPRLTVVTPCSQDWNAMPGNHRIRFCVECMRNVYNVAEMRQREVLDLIQKSEGRLPCMRLFRRPDGTIVTRDCRLRFGAAVRAARRRAWAAIGSVGALILGLFAGRAWRAVQVDELPNDVAPVAGRFQPEFPDSTQLLRYPAFPETFPEKAKPRKRSARRVDFDRDDFGGVVGGVVEGVVGGVVGDVLVLEDE